MRNQYAITLNPAEVFAKVRNAGSKAERIQILRDNESVLIKSILQANFKPSVVFEAEDPENFTPEKYENGQDPIPPLRLLTEMKKLLPNGSNWSQEKKNFTWFRILESLNADMAEVFLAMKHKQLGKKFRGLTAPVVTEAFPKLNIQ